MRIVNGVTILYILRYLPIFSAQNQYFHTVHMTHIKIYIVYLCCCTVWCITHNIYIGRFILYVKCIYQYFIGTHMFVCVCVFSHSLLRSIFWVQSSGKETGARLIYTLPMRKCDGALSKTPTYLYIYYAKNSLEKYWRSTLYICIVVPYSVGVPIYYAVFSV